MMFPATNESCGVSNGAAYFFYCIYSHRKETFSAVKNIPKIVFSIDRAEKMCYTNKKSRMFS